MIISNDKSRNLDKLHEAAKEAADNFISENRDAMEEALLISFYTALQYKLAELIWRRTHEKETVERAE